LGLVSLRLNSLAENSLAEKTVCERLLVLDVSLAKINKHLFDTAPHMARRRGSFYEELGAGDPVGAGAGEAAALRLIRTAPLAICKRAPSYFPEHHVRARRALRSSRTPHHHEWPIRI